MAKTIEKSGFKAVYVSGYGVSNSKLGYPDVGIITQNEMIETAKNIASSVNIPVISDANTGYGNYLNVIRAVKEFEKSGVCGIHIEDQRTPKRCGLMGGNTLISMEEMVLKIKAAINAREDPDFIIIARSDANVFESFDNAIKRGKAYAEAGADVIFLEYIESKSKLARIPKEIVGVPLLTCSIESKNSEIIKTKELEEMGFNIQIIPVSFMFAAYFAFRQALEEFKIYGHTKFITDKMYDISSFNKLMDIDKINEVVDIYEIAEKPCINCNACLNNITTTDTNIINNDEAAEIIIKRIVKEIFKKINLNKYDVHR